MFVPNNRVSKNVRQKLIELQEERDELIIIVGDFNICVSEMRRSNRQKISKDIVELRSTINQLDVIDIHWLLHPTTAGFTFFSSPHGTFTKIDHILGHNAHLNKFKRTRNHIKNTFRIKLEINNEKLENPPKYLEIKQHSSS